MAYQFKDSLDWHLVQIFINYWMDWQRFCTGINNPQRMTSHEFVNSQMFLLAPLWGWSFLILKWNNFCLDINFGFDIHCPPLYSSIYLYSRFNLSGHCDLDLWPLGTKLKWVTPLFQVNLCASIWKNSLIVIQRHPLHKAKNIDLTFDLCPPKSQVNICAKLEEILSRHSGDIKLWEWDRWTNQKHDASVPWL